MMTDTGCTTTCAPDRECGDDCWGDDGCKTDAGRCIRFTCTPGDSSKTACETCFGWKPVSYDQWMKQGYCADVSAKYRSVHQYETRCGPVGEVMTAPICCSTPETCGSGDAAWHFHDGNSNHVVGPCLGCMDVDNCSQWDVVDDGTYSRITACERG